MSLSRKRRLYCLRRLERRINCIAEYISKQVETPVSHKSNTTATLQAHSVFTKTRFIRSEFMTICRHALTKC
jgi:hypothetical protein